MRAVAVIGVVASMIVAGCSSLPTAGPTTSDVKHQEIKDNEVRFDLVDIDDNVV
ncbi:MAG: sugar transporter, partial [Alphaproteobacteria bacterium]